MSLIVVTQAKSVGATTTALALAASWPRAALVVEADHSGGDVAARAGLALVPGLVSLGATTRGAGLSPGDVLQHTQRLGGVVPVMVAPPGSGPAALALAAVDEGFPSTLAMLDGVDVIADLGRWDATEQGCSWLASATLAVVVARPDASGAAHLAALIESLAVPAEAMPAVVVITIGAQPYGPAEVADAVGVEVAGAIAFDPRGAAALGSGLVRGYVAERSALRRSAKELTRTLPARLPAPATANSAPGAVDREGILR